MVQLSPSGRAARLPRTLKAFPVLISCDGGSVRSRGERAADLGSVGWGFVSDCKLFGSACSVAVPALGRAARKSGKLGFSSRLCLAELDCASDLAWAASGHSSVK